MPQLIGLVQYFKSQSTLPVTYNFAGETFLPGASQWNQNLTGLLQELDYVNVRPATAGSSTTETIRHGHRRLQLFGAVLRVHAPAASSHHWALV